MEKPKNSSAYVKHKIKLKSSLKTKISLMGYQDPLIHRVK